MKIELNEEAMMAIMVIGVVCLVVAVVIFSK